MGECQAIRLLISLLVPRKIASIPLFTVAGSGRFKNMLQSKHLFFVYIRGKLWGLKKKKKDQQSRVEKGEDLEIWRWKLEWKRKRDHNCMLAFSLLRRVQGAYFHWQLLKGLNTTPTMLCPWTSQQACVSNHARNYCNQRNPLSKLRGSNCGRARSRR